MSVYTKLNQQDIEDLLTLYDLGRYESHQGISAGVENTNYFVNTHSHALVLTLFEKHDVAELPFFLQLSEHLYNDHCKVPQPFRSLSGELLLTVKDKPAVFIERLRGEHVKATPEYATEIAKALAAIHLSTQRLSMNRPHSHNLQWVQQQAPLLEADLTLHEQLLLKKSLNWLQKIPTDLPTGIIHADLFHDNALFENGHISGIIDWYFAGIDSFVLDIAITMNDWCLDDNKQFNLQQGELFVAAYQQVRPLTELELNTIGLMQIQAATRFWLSRLLAQKEHKQSNEHITVKDPNEMRTLLEQLLNFAV